MLRVSRDLDRLAIHDLDQKAAGIGTIIRTYRSFDLAGQKNPPY
jgi:hypothetical protein